MIDFSDGVRNSFRRIAERAYKLESTVELVGIVTRYDFYFSGPMLDAMESFAKEHGLTNYNCHVYATESVQNWINEFAQRKDADIVTTITHGRRGLAQLFNGSVTNYIMKSRPLPVLSIRV